MSGRCAARRRRSPGAAASPVRVPRVTDPALATAPAHGQCPGRGCCALPGGRVGSPVPSPWSVAPEPPDLRGQRRCPP
ncbi:hypothetical protein QJS66_09820 [Kocuria rhizophila]|nr:hypothetical protein QJS66_09820 [Kocuria rhizophila]